jgi:solute carrier family 35, member E1
VILFILNGLFHFVQNVLAFVVLSMVTPVTYSVSNTFKRVFVIVSSILWFRNPVTLPNAIGIFLSLTGLYLYSQAKRNEEHKFKN